MSTLYGPKWVVLAVKDLPTNARDVRDMSLIPGLGRSPEGQYGNPLQYSCPGKSHGQRSLAGYSPQGRKESDTIACTCRLSLVIYI